MKKPILAALAALTLSLAIAAAPILAQTAPGQARAHGGKLKKIANELNLTNAQKAQLKPIFQSARQQARAIKADTSLTPEARKAKLKELGRSARQQMLAILTPEQRAKLKAINQAHRNKSNA